MSDGYILKWRTRWNELELPGPTWNKAESPVTKWTQQRTDTKSQKFIGRNCACNTADWQNTTLAITIVTKSTIIDVCRWNLLERNETSNETEIKISLGTWPNFTNTFYHKKLHLRCREGVPIWLCFIYTSNKKAKQLS